MGMVPMWRESLARWATMQSGSQASTRRVILTISADTVSALSHVTWRAAVLLSLQK